MREDQFAALLLRFYLLFFTVPVVLTLLGRVVTDASAQRDIVLGALLVTVVYLVIGWPKGGEIHRTLGRSRDDTET